MKTTVVEYLPRIKDAGAETLVKDYALLLDKEKFDVVVLCENYEQHSANYKTLIENKIRIVSTYGKLDYICRTLSRLFGSKFRSKLLLRKIKDIRPNTIHIHLEQLEDIKNISNELKDIKLIYTCHNLPKRMIGEERPKEKEACEYLLKNNHLQIIALHEEMAKEINTRFKIDNTVVIKNGIDFNRFNNVTKDIDITKKELNIPKDSYIIGHIGRFHEQKNHDFIINIFNEIVKKRKDAYLLLVGDGKLKKTIIQKVNKLGIESKVLFLSNRNDIPELLKTMDVFLFPSKWEGLGIVLIEAQVSKVPCIISDKVPKEAIQSRLITRLSLDDTIDKWVDNCLHPISNVNEYGNIEDYDINKEIKKLEKLYL